MNAELLRGWRSFKGYGIRTAANAVGLSWQTYRRLELGYAVSGATVATVLRFVLTEDAVRVKDVTKRRERW